MPTIVMSTRGRITIPADLRRRLGITGKSRLEAEMRGEEVFLRCVKPESRRAPKKA